MDDPRFRLLSQESDIPRPRILCEGSLKRCLDELTQAVQVDIAACNRGTLTLTAVFESVDDAARQLDVPLLTLTTTGTSY